MSGAVDGSDALGEIAAAGKSPFEVLERTLDALRQVIGATCLSLVTRDDADAGKAQAWTAQADAEVGLAARCVEAGAAACLSSEPPLQLDGLSIELIDCGEGRRAALVGDFKSSRKSPGILKGCLPLLLENCRLSQALHQAEARSRKRITEVAAVYEIGQAISELDIDRLLPLITEKATAVMDAQACSLLLRDFDSDTLTIEASWGLAEDVVKGARIGMGEGIAGTVAMTGEAMLIVDVGSDPRFNGRAVSPRQGISSSICAPLKDEQGRVMGVLNIRRHVPTPPFEDEDVKLFCVFASQAALAICNARLYTSLSQRIAEMHTISDLLRAINSTLDLENVLEQIADSIVHVVGFDRCCVYLLDVMTDEFAAGTTRGYKQGELPERVRIGDGTIGLAAKECIPIFDRADEPAGEKSVGKPGAFLAAPIVVRDSCIGVVVVDNALTGRQVQPPEVDLLSMFVSQAGIAIENARLYESMEAKYSELNVLFEHSRTITSAYGLENVAHISMAVARKAVQCDGCILMLLGDRRSSVALQAAAGISQDVLDSIQEILSDETTVTFVREMRSPSVLSGGSMGDFDGVAAEITSRIIGRFGSVLVIPLIAEDVTVGAFLLVRHNRQEFGTGDIKLLSIVASQAAVVLKNALRYEQRMKRQVLDLSTLYEFSQRISSSSSLEEALDAILGIVSDLVDCDECTIYAADHSRDIIVAAAARPAPLVARRLASHPLSGNSVMSWTIRERKAIVSPDISQDSRFDAVPECERTVRSMMSIPLMVQDEAVGVLCVCSASPNLYSEDDVRMLSMIASQSAAIYKELEALATLTSYTDNILSSIAAGVATLDSDGVVITWNRAAESITRVMADEMVGLHYNDALKHLRISDADRASTVQMIEKVRNTSSVYQGYKLCYHPPDRDPRYVNISASVLWNNSGEAIGQVIIFEDITKEINMENEFRRMEELAAVGQLAASIAHELRNPLSSIKGAAQFLQKEYEHESSIVEFLDIIIEEVNGLSKLTTEFLEFARPMEFEIGPVDLNEIVTKTLQLMSMHISESGVVISDHLDQGLPKLEADAKQLEQVLRNTILNALQAMPDGGTLSIQTHSSGQEIELSISDTGVGIPEDRLERVFIPFFTTKTKGTGLGLSIVQKIVENHGGRIDVKSTVGQGTTFRISLPLPGTVRPSPPETDTTERRTV